MVAEGARSVRVHEERVADYAADWREPPVEVGDQAQPDPEAAAAFAICMNAINFGSGWWPSYEGHEVPFCKRAQLVAADLHRAGLAELPGIERLTAFADNLVPHVLRVDGVLELDRSLTARIEAEELLAHGSPEEVELRACAVHAIELLAADCDLTPAKIDSALWNRGREPGCKSLPRPRCRNTAY